MRVESVSRAKNGRGTISRGYPRIGSTAAMLYDQLYAHRGRTTIISGSSFVEKERLAQAIRDLMNYYGCDIRHGLHKCEYLLAGEWFGSHYVDYVIEAIREAAP